MLATFSSKMALGCGAAPLFLLGLCYFLFFSSSWPLPGSIALDFGGFGLPFWRFWGFIFGGSGGLYAQNFGACGAIPFHTCKKIGKFCGAARRSFVVERRGGTIGAAAIFSNFEGLDSPQLDRIQVSPTFAQTELQQW